MENNSQKTIPTLSSEAHDPVSSIQQKDLSPEFIACIECVLDAGYASPRLLQQCCDFNFFRASNLIHKMENLGIISPCNGKLPGAILISREDWEEMVSSITGERYIPEPAFQDSSSSSPNDKCELTDSLYDIAVATVLDNGDKGENPLSLFESDLVDTSCVFRLLDKMEEDGIIGPYREGQPREIFYTRKQWDLEHPDFSDRLAKAINIEQEKRLEKWNKVSSLPSFKLSVILHTFLVWLFAPLPIFLYIICLVTVFVIFNGSPSLMLCGTTILFILLRCVYDHLTPYSNGKITRRVKLRMYIRQKWGVDDPNPSFTHPLRNLFKTATTVTATPPQTGSVETNPIQMDTMDGHQFEYFCADLLRQNGFTNVEVTQASGDYGIDVLAEKEDVTYAIQCKCYSDNVGNHAVQEAHSGAAYYGRMVPVVMTNRYFTRAAKETASQIHVLLWDRDKILQMMEK